VAAACACGAGLRGGAAFRFDCAAAEAAIAAPVRTSAAIVNA
jgi:hypothetical protein